MDLREQALGDGSFSVCRRCVHKTSGQEMAVKIVSRRVDCGQEINLLRACQGHPNIVRLHDVFYDEVHSPVFVKFYFFFPYYEHPSSHKTYSKI
jgi:ribosomal protein S6 kinase alpha-5